VRYLEVRYAPVLNVQRGLDLGAAVEAPLRGLARAERDHGVMRRIIVCAIRNMEPDVSLELARLAVAYRKRGVVGFDLAGGEAGNPASRHLRAFEHARGHDLACTCHAGEGAGAESCRDAVHVCGADRLGHATRLFEDESLLEYVNDRRICLECCLTSNVQTRAATSYETHPFRRYFDRGLNVVLNTDNRLMSGTTLVDEYAHAARELNFTFEELSRVALNGFESAFLPYEERRALVERARGEGRGAPRDTVARGHPMTADADAAASDAALGARYGTGAARAAADEGARAARRRGSGVRHRPRLGPWRARERPHRRAAAPVRGRAWLPAGRPSPATRGRWWRARWAGARSSPSPGAFTCTRGTPRRSRGSPSACFTRWA
jgi:adenosine deaminase